MGMTYSIGQRQVTITFDSKPDERVRSCLKANSFRWNPAGGYWWRTRVTGAADVIAAVRKLTESKRPDGKCWKCQSAEGYFRNFGAATPVYCDACAKVEDEKRYGWLDKKKPAEQGLADMVDLAYEDDCARQCGL